MTDLPSLSDREIEILELLATGKTNKEIARDLHISANTVKVHLRNIFGKLEVTSRTEASMVALQEGLIDTGLADAQPAANHAPHAESRTIARVPSAGSNSGVRAQTWILVGVLVTITLLALIAFRLFNPVSSTEQAPVSDSVAIESQWQERASLPAQRTKAAAAAFENSVFVIGGLIGGTPSGGTSSLNPEEGRWSDLAHKPTPVFDIQAAVLGGMIYVPGGRMAGGRVSSGLEIYDPLNDTWGTGPDLPFGIGGYALTAHEGKLYLFGGYDGSEFTDKVLSFDPDTFEWRELTAIPEPLGYSGAVAVGSRIYLIGGFDGQRALSTVYVYSPPSDGSGGTWSQAAPLPEGRYAMGLVSVADRIHLIGGLGGAEGHFTQMEYTPQTDLWQVIENPLAGRWSFPATAAIGTDIFVLGGELDGTPTERSLSYQVLYIVVIPVIR